MKRLVAPGFAAKRFASPGALLLLAALGGACGEPEPVGPRVIVLGFDGMDYGLTSRLISEGRLPNLARLAESGSFAPLETSIPPQSPVAWSDFITGMDAG
ncbi:MAG: alkaline phosphatase family protein, partial [Gemmatimonadota bacterium]